ncbi:ABC transporter ATP-binding protein [Labrys monachus]|uniref:ABC-type Fe3+/spermidine/putrescine transport system ATPase subunit n=1 Tax=Labrys monachus TaxID=217067 RepID=A0ABU0FG11_9HYPH|nr:ABC transporter ATP-binding protein [Labrys monachus]MDQ0393532.1 ABC-type Fe3+/spermidine/putrescine transport system ATPase subunit [Labrys monachus]
MHVELESIAKSFGSSCVLRGVDLTVESGSLVTLLGPSGCGKTTLLRILAGFLHPDAGKVLFGGQRVEALPPYRRGAAMVFQSYAIFPHLTVADNVAYGLKARGVGRAEREARVRDILAKVRMSGYEARMPSQLSGGQKQRVGLARALVIRPDLLLMDEPLSNLDATLRIEMREEIRLLQRDYGITTIYVTHDQEEALAISDKVALMNSGIIRQYGTPTDLYHHPQHVIVAEFIGRSNLLDGEIRLDLGIPALVGSGGGRLAGPEFLGRLSAATPVRIAFRPEAAAVLEAFDAAGSDGIACNLVLASFLGAHCQVRLAVDQGGEVELRVPGTHPVMSSASGSRWRLHPDPAGLHLFSPKDGKVLAS